MMPSDKCNYFQSLKQYSFPYKSPVHCSSGQTENWDFVKSGRECLQRCNVYNPTNMNETYTSRHSTIEERPLLRDFRRFKRLRKDPHDTRTATLLLRVSPTQQCILHLSDTPPPNTRHLNKDLFWSFFKI